MLNGAGSTAAPAWIVALVATVFLLREASQLLIPVVLAVLISYALEPVVAWMARHGVHRGAGAGLLLSALVALGAYGVYSLRDDARQALDSLPEVARRAREIVWPTDGSGPARPVREAVDVIQGSAQAGGTSGGGPPSSGAASGQGQASADGGRRASGSGSQASGTEEQPSGPGGQPSGGGDGQPAAAGGAVSGWAQRALGSVLALAGHVTVIFFLVFFLLMTGGHFRRRVIEVAGTRLERRRVTATIIDDINRQVQRFLLVRLVTAVVVGAATWLVLVWMQVGQAAIWGILAGVFNSIPYFGPIIVSGGLFLVGLVQAGDPMLGVKVGGAALAITSLEGWLLTPPLMGKAERMHVLVVFLGVLVWTWIWGAWGTILAVPMLVVVKSVADHVDALEPVSRLMAP